LPAWHHIFSPSPVTYMVFGAGSKPPFFFFFSDRSKQNLLFFFFWYALSIWIDKWRNSEHTRVQTLMIKYNLQNTPHSAWNCKITEDRKNRRVPVLLADWVLTFQLWDLEYLMFFARLSSVDCHGNDIATKIQFFTEPCSFVISQWILS
jgi:hypothetical protein